MRSPRGWGLVRCTFCGPEIRGRDGSAKTPDGRLSVALNMPKELGGPGGDGTNPEQLFAAGYAACLLRATKLVARLNKVSVADTSTVTAIVGTGRAGDRYELQVELRVSLPGIDHQTAERQVEEAHQRCPYSNAISGITEVILTVVEYS